MMKSYFLNYMKHFRFIVCGSSVEVAGDGEQGKECVFINWKLLRRANFTDAKNGYIPMTEVIIQS